MKHTRFHGRVEGAERICEAEGCKAAGEFRAPGSRTHGFDGPGDWRWFCLDHVRAFNSAYDWFEGMTPDEIFEAQSPVAGWRRDTRAFRADAGVDGMPRWADFDDPLDAIGARASDIRRRAQQNQSRNTAFARFTPREREALDAMGLGGDADRSALRRRYSQLVRKYHPDRNGGDRSQEGKLGRVVEAYQLLRKSPAFA
ncbi:MAG TPA: J domain-containing protein [Sphingomonadaceae bacterium]